MQVISSIDALRTSLSAFRKQNELIAFVPTMGALHDGHRACIEVAKKHGDRVVVSIFVNPTQFGPGEDLARYPNTLDTDLAICKSLACDVVFTPRAAEVYPTEQTVWVQPGVLAERLCGRTRPDHFRGVCTVVAKLFHLVRPGIAVFGQKDAQQALLLQEMVRQLNIDIRLEICPIIREPDGLALSSRNAYLDPTDRSRAPAIYRALEQAFTAVVAGERATSVIRNGVLRSLAGGGIAQVEYVELILVDGLTPIETLRSKVLLAIAAKIGSTRLIDNLVFAVPDKGKPFRDTLF